MGAPYGYYHAYRNLDVPLSSGLQVSGLDVHEYRNARTYWAKRAAGAAPARNDFDVFDGMDRGWYPLWARIQKATIKQIGQRGRVVVARVGEGPGTDPVIQIEEIGDWYELLRVYEGKGSPAAIKQALRLAHLFGLVEANKTAMQAYCDEYIGLDCNGFVGNFLRDSGVAAPGASLFDTPETLPLDFAPPGKRLARVGDVDSETVMVWADGGHIALIDTLEDVVSVGMDPVTRREDVTSRLVSVCESTGGRTVKGDIHTDGLNCTRYLIKSVGRDRVFQVARAGGWEKSAVWSKLKDGSFGQAWTEGVFISRLL